MQFATCHLQPASIMFDSISIKSLYTPALAEGEGVGTAYEYFAKRLVIGPWLRQWDKRPSKILMAGCPEKYGSSLDFVLLAAELGAELQVVDDRPAAVEKARKALETAQSMGWLPRFEASYSAVSSLSEMSEVKAAYDLILSSEVLQRFVEKEQQVYIDRVRQIGTAVAIFAPNGDNKAHTHISGLSGITLDQMRRLTGDGWQCDTIDMPPFPPGIVRSEEQREQASSGLAESIAMWGLGFYARFEKLVPTQIRHHQSHIVYALSPISS